MKRNYKPIIARIVLLVAVVLIVINRKDAGKQDAAVREKQLEFEIKGESAYFGYDENDEGYVTFATQMKRKNGDVFDKEYSGIELSRILSKMDVEVGPDTSVSVICADNYEITLTGEEILEEGNIYLVTKENGEDLGEDSGPFMLVVNNDEFSTRWAKNVVKIRIDG